MAVRKSAFLVLLVLLASFLHCTVLGDKLQSKIYKSFKSFFPCVLLTNATHSIGCTSSMNGNVGVLHLITNSDHLEWLIKRGTHKPYIPLISSDMFTKNTMDRLAASKKINGALVISAGKFGQTPLAGFSPDPVCPLDEYGMYSENKDYGSCKKVEWNKKGNSMSMVFYDLPIFALGSEEEVNETIKCIEKHNSPSNGNLHPEYPLCAVELKDFMFAAKDTPTCKRRSDSLSVFQSSQNTFCDPLGDWNVWGTLYPLTSPVASKEVIIISSKMDSSGFFHDLAPGANNDVSGIVTLLGAAYALGELKRQIKSGKLVGHKMKPIMFVLFNGEIWDYIGSSRMVWDMESGSFPYPMKHEDKKDWLSKMDLSNIGYFIEISQVGQMENNTVWMHSDPISTKDADVKKEVEKMESLLKAAGKGIVGVQRANENDPLPPASLQRFLKSKKGKKIPGIVLADHDKEFKNMYYNSRYDNAENIGLKFEIIKKGGKSYLSTRKNESEELANLAKTVATAAYKLATDGQDPPAPVNVSAQQIADLISCFLISASCPVFREIIPLKAKDTLPKKPYSRYISVAQLTNPITDIIYLLLGYYTGNWTKYDAENCTEIRGNPPLATSRFGLKGPSNSSGICVEFSIHKTAAVSPAFELKDYKSTEYSTWAESMWNSDFGVRMFLVAGPAMEYTVFGCGLLVLILSFITVYVVYRRAETMFTPTSTWDKQQDESEAIVN